MKIFVGDIVRNEVARAGKTKTQLSTDVGISRTHLNNILGEDQMELEYVVKIGKSIRHDFTSDLPEVAKHIISEAPHPYGKYTNAELREDLLDLQQKYIALQGEHIKLLNELRQYEKGIKQS